MAATEGESVHLVSGNPRSSWRAARVFVLSSILVSISPGDLLASRHALMTATPDPVTGETRIERPPRLRRGELRNLEERDRAATEATDPPFERTLGSRAEPRAVIGADDRIRLSSTTSFPAQAVVKLEIWFTKGS